MVIKKNLGLIEQSVEVWNEYRQKNARIMPDFKKADLRGERLRGINFWWVKLIGASLVETDLRDSKLALADVREANLTKANLENSNLSKARFQQASLKGANLRYANLTGADLSNTDLRGADLTGANLSGARLIDTCIDEAKLEGCRIYGVSAWNLIGIPENQSNLIITPQQEAEVTVDNLEVAQFIYLLLNNNKIRNVIDTITSKVVLILGRFKPERKIVLDSVREALREHDYLPILFDFEKPVSRDLTESISTLAHMARFVIADITDAKSIPQELTRIIPGLPSVPVQPIIANNEYEYAMFEHFRRYPWVLEEYRYDSIDDLLGVLNEKVIEPAESMANKQIPG
ncbi:MAG: pentapeptide repeat-containing protein [Pseudomonadota bacterium]|nr:pentapeptide repeat-containing protein [Pseudomonadota bacterium]